MRCPKCRYQGYHFQPLGEESRYFCMNCSLSEFVNFPKRTATKEEGEKYGRFAGLAEKSKGKDKFFKSGGRRNACV